MPSESTVRSSLDAEAVGEAREYEGRGEHDARCRQIAMTNRCRSRHCRSRSAAISMPSDVTDAGGRLRVRFEYVGSCPQ